MNELINLMITLFGPLLFTASGGLLLGYLLSRMGVGFPRFGRSLWHVSRVGTWVPVLMLMPLTDWLYENSHVTHRFSSVTIGIVGVMLCVSYHYRASCLLPDADNRKTLVCMSRAALIYAVLVSLVIHLRIDSHYWFSLPPGSEIAHYGYIAAAVLAVVLLVIDYGLTPSPDEMINETRKLVQHDIRKVEKGADSNIILVGLMFGISFALWVAVFGWESVALSIQVIQRLKALVLGAPILTVDDSIWKHFGMSLLAVVAGTSVAIVFATLGERFCRKSRDVQSGIVRLLAPTHVMTILLPCFLLSHSHPGANIWFSVQVISLLTFFPIFEIFLCFRETRGLCKVLLALDRSIGYGFVGMLVGESIHASYGVGLAITITGATSEAITSLAIAIVLVTGFIILTLGNL